LAAPFAAQRVRFVSVNDWATAIHAASIQSVLKFAVLNGFGFSDWVTSLLFLDKLVVFELVLVFA